MTSREKFEAWMTAEQWFHGSDFEWDERRNCYAQFGIHLAYKAFLAAEVAAEQKLTDMEVQLANAESKCRELAAENTELKSDRDTLARYWIEGGGDEECANSYCEQTPATDAFLAEMRAQGVDQFKEYMRTTGYPWEGDWHGIGRMTDKFAAQLRQGGAA